MAAPLPARFLLCLLSFALVAACESRPPPPVSPANLCGLEATAITSVQGTVERSPLEGQVLNVRGVVTLLRPGSGFYLEDTGQPRAGSASRALFISDDGLSRSLRAGAEIAVRGRVAELGSRDDTLTALAGIESHEVCSRDNQLPLSRARLPMDPATRESLEAMRLSFDQPLWVSDVYSQYRGEMTISSGGPLRVPTELATPGPAARKIAAENHGRALVLDMDQLAPGPWPSGTELPGVVGIMGNEGGQLRLLVSELPAATVPPAQVLEPPVPRAVRIVSLNLLNFFNGDGEGGGFPTLRGAESPEEYQAQSERLRAAFTEMRADLIAVQELENDGFGPASAAVALLDLLNSSGNSDWRVVDPGAGPIGGDVITVGIYFRQSVFEPVGEPQVLTGPEFTGLSRQPLAQNFRHRASGRHLLVVSHHLKSKGRCPDSGEDVDAGDGQGCWNAARVSAVRAQFPWIREVSRAGGTDNILVLGDMNAWRLEDPIAEFLAGGLVDLVEKISGLPQQSYVYWGQAGTLDYAFATPELAAFAVRAQNWNINSGWPRRMELAPPWLRVSDHDPVVVDFAFSHSETSD